MWRPDTFLALHEDVITFAWSAPMRELAATIGISDVGLKKLLKAHGIATPPQGHWNRVHAGRPVTAPPKPPARGPGESGRVRLDPRFRGHVSEAAPMPEEGPFASRLVPEDLGELRANELKAIGKAVAPRDLSRPPIGMARLLRKERERSEKAAASRWSSDEAHFDGALAQRQLRLLAGLLLALAKRGHGGEVWEDTYALRGLRGRAKRPARRHGLRWRSLRLRRPHRDDERHYRGHRPQLGIGHRRRRGGGIRRGNRRALHLDDGEPQRFGLPGPGRYRSCPARGRVRRR
ncbi:hypothetical protein [Tsuneonella deserti]|uniref:hypothetical protein n=1 Tax=Tsuneonella deserti TaxID=2035528 RepID=UPI001E28C76F|nr:hypothetical protein [Tsuneonella deserti]